MVSWAFGKNKGTTPWGALVWSHSGFGMFLNLKSGTKVVHVCNIANHACVLCAMNSWYQQAQVYMWKQKANCAAHRFSFQKLTCILRFFVFSLHSSFWRVDPTSVHTILIYPVSCWWWKVHCHWSRVCTASFVFRFRWPQVQRLDIVYPLVI